MEYIITLLALTMPMLSLHATVTSDAIRVEHTKTNETRNIHLHEDDGYYYISDDTNTTLRQAYTLLPGASDILDDTVTKAWYDYDKTVVYMTSDKKLSAIFPVYHVCAITRQQITPPEGHQYVGIYPNPEYRLPSVPFYAIGASAANCFVFTDGVPYKTEPVKAVLYKKVDV